ncbi:MAG: hypothetical protein Q9157_001124 [Trypethelium eluteriae]
MPGKKDSPSATLDWVKQVAGKSTKVRAETTALDTFWEALRQDVLVRSIRAKIPGSYTRILQTKSLGEFIKILETGGSSLFVEEKEFEKYGFMIWKCFQEAFKPAVQLFEGYPLACPDFCKGYLLSALPTQVKKKIIGYLVPTSEIFGLVVTDCLVTTNLRAHQTSYNLQDRVGRLFTRTYGVSRRGSPPWKLPSVLAPFLKSRAFCRYVQELVYAGGIDFRGSPESVSAFMHDRMNKLDLMTKIRLSYRFEDTAPTKDPRTTLGTSGAWRKLSNMLVHDCIGLKDVKILVNKDFWNKIAWERHGADHYATVSELIRLPRASSKETGLPPDIEYDRPCGFLERVGRLSNEQIHLEVEIQGADTKEKKNFQKAVDVRLYHCTGVRKPLAEEKKRC